MFKESITKEELTDLPLRWFEGDIYIIDKPGQVSDVAEFLSTSRLLDSIPKQNLRLKKEW